MQRETILLASASPRRASYLKELGIRFRTFVPDVDERTRRGETPRRYVRRLAMAKALAVAGRHAHHWVVGADTTVVVEGAMLGKPRNATDARRMLRRLSGRSHRVVSGIALVRRDAGFAESEVSTTKVYFRRLTEKEIRWYVATGEPFDKAGAYGIQGKGGLFVTRIEGSFSNVVGFPLERLYELLKRGQPFDINIFFHE